jgi:hypothetical protein
MKNTHNVTLKQTQTLHRNHFPIRETLLPSEVDPKKIKLAQH